jgi:histidinol-phosphate aminotransferase
MTQPPVRPGLQTIAPYVQGKSAIEGCAEPIKLSSNESSFGPSPQAILAFQAAATQLHRYPDGSQQALRGAIAEVHGLPAANIVCGNGSEELIGLLMRAYVGEGDEVVLSQNGFVMCEIYTRGQGATPVVAAEREHRIDVDALLAAVTPRTKMVCIANPNNPTGTYLPLAEIERLHRALPAQVLLLLDGAYAEFVLARDFDAGAALVAANTNVVMTRTFSKIYGLSGLRIGWAYAPAAVIDAVQRIRTPFNTNAAALAAAAAAVRDQAFVEQRRRHNHAWLQTLAQAFAAMEIEMIPSVANFYLLRFDGRDGKTAAAAAAHLRASGIIPRPVGDASSPYLRITVGLATENEAVIKALREFMRPH